MDQLPNYGLANTVTGFATMFSGMMMLALCYLHERHPPRWMFVYWLIVITGVFTITLHGFGETNPVWGQRWFWAFLDTGSNIVVTWGICRAVLFDYYSEETRRRALPAIHALMLIGVAWHFVDRWNSAGAGYLVDFGNWGGFRPGQTWLILFSLLATALFFAKRKAIPDKALPLIQLTTLIFLFGLFLATAKSTVIVQPFIPLHALWHVVGAFGFIALWAFNDVRFRKN